MWSGQLNVLIATNIGSEGMDFKQCQVRRPLGCAFLVEVDSTQQQWQGRLHAACAVAPTCMRAGAVTTAF